MSFLRQVQVCCIVLGSVVCQGIVTAEEPPVPPTANEVKEVLAAARPGTRPDISARPLRVLLLADQKDHGPGEHDYPRWQSRWALLLGGVTASHERYANLNGVDISEPALLAGAENVRVITADQWPTAEQWKQADVVVIFCYLTWTPERMAELRQYLEGGGGVVMVHSATWTRQGPDPEVAKLIGVGGFTKYRHGPIDVTISKADHPICQGLPQVIRLVDESYFPPTPPIDAERVQVLAVSEEVSDDGHVATAQPMFWTYELGKGRVYGCVLGHYNWTFDNPYFRLLLLRGTAWAAKEDPRRFDPIVLRGAAVRK